MAQVIESGKATLLELREKYSLEEMYTIWEVHYTTIYNQWVKEQRAIQEAKLRNR